MHEPKWCILPKQVSFNINRYIAKYDFEISRKVRGVPKDVLPYTEKQRLFHKFAMMELLYDISKVLNGGKRYYNRLSTIDGCHIDKDITKIPEDAKLLVVSYVPEHHHHH